MWGDFSMGLHSRPTSALCLCSSIGENTVGLYRLTRCQNGCIIHLQGLEGLQADTSTRTHVISCKVNARALQCACDVSLIRAVLGWQNRYTDFALQILGLRSSLIILFVYRPVDTENAMKLILFILYATIQIHMQQAETAIVQGHTWRHTESRTWQGLRK